jgi:hypothetical protein
LSARCRQCCSSQGSTQPNELAILWLLSRSMSPTSITSHAFPSTRSFFYLRQAPDASDGLCPSVHRARAQSLVWSFSSDHPLLVSKLMLLSGDTYLYFDLMYFILLC